MDRLFGPYGCAEQVLNVAKVGKSKTPLSLVARMPSAEVAAKVGPPIERDLSIGCGSRVERLNSRG